MYFAYFIIDDPDAANNPLKCPYRKFMRERANFHNVINMEDTKILDLIDLNYRLVFFKDVIASGWIEKETEFILNQVIKDAIFSGY